MYFENREVEGNDSQISMGAWIAKVEPNVCATVPVFGGSLRPHRAHDKPVSCVKNSILKAKIGLTLND